MTGFGPEADDGEPSYAPPPTPEDVRAFSQFYTDHMAKLIGYLMALGATSDAAADCAQEAMTRAFHWWTTIREPAAWTRTAASRIWFSHLRRPAESPLVDLDGAEIVMKHHDSRVEDALERHSFLRLIEQIPLRQRDILLRTYEGETPTQIAKALGLNAATVRSNLRHARRSMQQSLDARRSGWPL